MGEPVVMYCVGATKAGTSWLYRYLHGRDDCHFRSVKELHYFDTFEADARDKQLQQFLTGRDRFVKTRVEAEQAKKGWKVRNMDRRIADMDELIRVIGGVRDRDAAYIDYLHSGIDGQRLVGDMTPGYSLLDENMYRQMEQASPNTRFVFLMRDPVERLWSHVRMQAKRFLQPGEEVEIKAGRILNRTMNKGQETHIPARGDYRGTVQRLRAALPPGKLLVEYAENLLTEAGLKRLCAFLGLPMQAAETQERVHEGIKISLDDEQRSQTARFLEHQYEWAAQNVGPLPEAWQNNLARV